MRQSKTHKILLLIFLLGIALLGKYLLSGKTISSSFLKPPKSYISGFVFRDHNNNGQREDREPGEPDILVSIYGEQGNLIVEGRTDINGNFSLDVKSGSQKFSPDASFRVVFSGWEAHLAPGPHGLDSGTEIQFAAAGDTKVSFGLTNPEQYVPDDQPSVHMNTDQETQSASQSGLQSEASSLQETDWLYEGQFDAPDFPEDLEWLNTPRPLTLDDLRGKVVVLEFWTYGCIACVHEIPKLNMLAQAYPQELVIVGVHSAKYPHESQSDNILQFLERYQIEFPVINDNDHIVAKSFRANVWPSYIIITPTGKILTGMAGSMRYDEWYQLIEKIVAEFEERALMDPQRQGLEFGLVAAPETLLRFPGAVLADEEEQRLFIVDSYHNRILISDLSGLLLDVIGSGSSGQQDGDYASASFFYPQGIALADEHTLYVADSENHLLRRVDLLNRRVETAAGVGERIYLAAEQGIALEARLNSPWDVLFLNGQVFIAMAGQHQLWVYNPAAQTVALHAGSGLESFHDAPLQSAGLSQPMALTTDGETIYFADSENNAIRQADIDPTGEVVTIAGLGFWAIGDQDGDNQQALLQRPIGIAYHDGQLYFSDTYNNKIKIIDLENRQTRSFLGTGSSAWRDGVNPSFFEPAGLSIAGDKLYIADSNNHAVRVVDLATNEASTLVLRDPAGLLNHAPGDEVFTGKQITLETQTVAPGTGSVKVNPSLPEGYKLNPLARSQVQWQSQDSTVAIIDAQSGQPSKVEPFVPLETEASFAEGITTLTGSAMFYFCEIHAEPLCMLDEVQFIQPIRVSPTSDLHTLTIEYQLDPLVP